MSTDYKVIYQNQAAAYDRMVEAEDCEGNLLPAIQAVMPLDGARVIEVGIGTARVTRLLVRGGASWVLGVDESEHMLEVARQHLTREAPPGGPCRWQLAKGDVAAIPAPDSAADLAIAGWVYGHMTQWFEDNWRPLVDRALGELERVTRPGGAEIIIETLGTGADHPHAPSPALAAYYAHLEHTHGFRREALRTDYAFATAEEAAAACGFFFGDAFARMILDRGWARVPEWTGLWWRRRNE